MAAWLFLSRQITGLYLGIERTVLQKKSRILFYLSVVFSSKRARDYISCFRVINLLSFAIYMST